MKKILLICLLVYSLGAGLGACMCPKASTAPTGKKTANVHKTVATKASHKGAPAKAKTAAKPVKRKVAPKTI